MTTLKQSLVVGVAALVVSFASACGSSSGTSSSGSGSGADVAKAASIVDMGTKATSTFVKPGPAFDITKVTKPVWLLAASFSNANTAPVVQGFVAAGQAANVPAHVCQAQGSPEGNAACISQA